MAELTVCSDCGHDVYLNTRCPNCKKIAIARGKKRPVARHGPPPPPDNMPVTYGSKEFKDSGTNLSQKKGGAVSKTYYCSKCGIVANDYQKSQIQSGINIRCQVCKNTLFTLSRPSNVSLQQESITEKKVQQTKQNLPKTIKCQVCKNVISERAITCPKCGYKKNEELKCSICNELIPRDSKSCPECGDPHPFEESLPIKSGQSMSKSKPKTHVTHSQAQANGSTTQLSNLGTADNKITSKDIKLYKRVCAVLIILSIFIILFVSRKLGFPLLALSLFFFFASHKEGDRISKIKGR